MPAILAMLGGMLTSIAPHLVSQVLISLGIAVVTYSGLDFAMSFAKAQAVAGLVALPPTVLAVMSVLKVGVCINIVFSAMAMRATLNGFRNGVFKRWSKV